MSQQGLRIIDLATIRSAVDHKTAFNAVSDALRLIADEGVEAPEELALKLTNAGEIHIKGARLREQPWVVFKVATGSFPMGTNSGCSILLDAETGEPSAILDDGGWLTEMRTAAAGVVAADLLAAEGPLAVAVLGTGVQARYQLAALRDRRDVSDVRVWGRDNDKAKDFGAEVTATPCVTVEEAVAGANVIVTATSATSPILFGHHLQPGVHVTAMGADMTGKNELAGDVLDRATVIAPEDVTVSSRVGELQHALNHVDRAVGLPTVLANALAGSPARHSVDDITVADLCGLGAYDAAIASAAAAALGI